MARRTIEIACCVAFLVAVVAAPTPPEAAATTLPPGFVEEQVIAGLSQPVAMAWLHDGRFLVTEKPGRLKLIDPALQTVDLVLDLEAEVNNYNDRGLLGLAVDPDFPAEPEVYLSYTYDPPETLDPSPWWDGNGDHRRRLAYGGPDGPGHRVARVDRISLDPATGYSSVVEGSRMAVLGANSTWENIGDPFTLQTDVEAPWTCSSYQPGQASDEGVPIPDCMASDGGSHSVGALRFASDGSLFISLGDAGSYNQVDPRALRALRVDHLEGKILRVDPDTGLGVPGNPHFVGDGSSTASKVYLSGLRNPFRFAVTSDDSVFTGDVGWGQFEEINTAAAGGSFGWPCFEGGLSADDLSAGVKRGPGVNRPQPSYDDLPECQPYYDGSQVPPAWTWCHHAAKASCSDSGHSAMAGVSYEGTAYPPEYRGIWFADIHENWMSVLQPDGGSWKTTPVSSDVTFPLDLSIGPEGNVYYVSLFGTVERIRYVGGGNIQPSAVASASVGSGPLPLVVQFVGSNSFDPDLDRLSYEWDFGDGATSSEADPLHTYAAVGSFTAVLTVTDPWGSTSTASLDIEAGNSAPVPTIVEPVDGSVVSIDTLVNFLGSATDPEDGPLPGSDLIWTGILHHNDHTHENEFIRTGERPSEGYVFADHDDDTWLEVCLLAFDSSGVEGRSCVNVYLVEVDLTLDSVPQGLDLVYNGQQHATPFSVRVPAGVERNVDAPSPQSGGWTFASWGSGGARAKVITTPPADDTITANFERPTVSRVLFVAGTAGPPRGDRPLVEYWVGRGFEVTVVDDDALPSVAEAESYDFVWISSTVNPLTVGAAFVGLGVPLGTHEAYLYDDLGLAVRSGQVAGLDRVIDVVGGSTMTTSAARTFSWAVPVSDAAVLATQPGKSGRAVVFTLGAGDVLSDGSVAASCRAGFFGAHDTPPVLTGDGWGYLDTLTGHLLSCSSSPDPDQLRFSVGPI